MRVVGLRILQQRVLLRRVRDHPRQQEQRERLQAAALEPRRERDAVATAVINACMRTGRRLATGSATGGPWRAAMAILSARFIVCTRSRRARTPFGACRGAARRACKRTSGIIGSAPSGLWHEPYRQHSRDGRGDPEALELRALVDGTRRRDAQKLEHERARVPRYRVAEVVTCAQRRQCKQRQLCCAV